MKRDLDWDLVFPLLAIAAIAMMLLGPLVKAASSRIDPVQSEAHEELDRITRKRLDACLESEKKLVDQYIFERGQR